MYCMDGEEEARRRYMLRLDGVRMSRTAATTGEVLSSIMEW